MQVQLTPELTRAMITHCALVLRATQVEPDKFKFEVEVNKLAALVPAEVWADLVKQVDAVPLEIASEQISAAILLAADQVARLVNAQTVPQGTLAHHPG